MEDTLKNRRAFHTEQADACVKTAKAHRTLAALHADNPKMADAHKALADCASDCADSHIRMCKALPANSNANDIDHTDVDTETNRGRGGDLDGPKEKAFGMRAMIGDERDFSKLEPTRVRAVVPSTPFIPRPGGPSAVPSSEASTDAIDRLKK